MNYPFWDVPFIGSGWVVGLIAIFHVMIALFAVGGGTYLVLAEQKALREGRRERREPAAHARRRTPANCDPRLPVLYGMPYFSHRGRSRRATAGSVSRAICTVSPG